MTECISLNDHEIVKKLRQKIKELDNEQTEVIKRWKEWYAKNPDAKIIPEWFIEKLSQPRITEVELRQILGVQPS